MMSEKRFIWKCDDETCHIFDTVTKARYFYEGIMNLLNEQQATIRKLQDLCGASDGENAKLRIENKRLQEAIDYLKTVIRYTIPNEMVADVFKQIGEEYE